MFTRRDNLIRHTDEKHRKYFYKIKYHIHITPNLIYNLFSALNRTMTTLKRSDIPCEEDGNETYHYIPTGNTENVYDNDGNFF